MEIADREYAIIRAKVYDDRATLELPQELYDRLSQEAVETGDSVQAVAQRLLEERFGLASAASEREHVAKVLRSAGLLAELGPAMQERAPVYGKPGGCSGGI